MDIRQRFIGYPGEFIEVPEAAGMLRVTKGAVRQMLREGRIAGVKVGGRIWIWTLSLEQLIVVYGDPEIDRPRQAAERSKTTGSPSPPGIGSTG